jgi:shikimate kinase
MKKTVAIKEPKSFNLVLVGMPGSGKTTVGKTLARNLNLTFIDTDAFIEKTCRLTIHEIFTKLGEPYFRTVEAETVRQMLKHNDQVIATGGGAVLEPETRVYLQKANLVVYLHTKPRLLFTRLQNDKRRPLLQRPDLLHYLQKLYQDRHPFYQEVSSLVLPVDKTTSLAEVINKITMQVEILSV